MRPPVQDGLSGQFGVMTYDVIVDHAGGGDYTSIGTACAAAGDDATIYVAPGTYSESADDVLLGEGQTLVGYSITMNLDAGFIFGIAASEPNASIIGTWTVSGDGTATRANLFTINADYINVVGRIKINSTKRNISIPRLVYSSAISVEVITPIAD